MHCCERRAMALSICARVDTPKSDASETSTPTTPTSAPPP